MPTGIELGPSSCVLVRTHRDGSVRGAGAATITAARTIDARHHRALALALGAARREDGFDARARVVAWGAPGAQIALDLDRLPDVSPLIEAGFEIESIVSPPQALAMMLESMRVDTRRAVAAVALNRAGSPSSITGRLSPRAPSRGRSASRSAARDLNCSSAISSSRSSRRS
jgi:hypothetical protein